MRIFTKAEVEAMIQSAPSLWWRAFIRLAVTSGMRRDELLNLQWRDVDIGAATVKVQPKKSETFQTNGRSLKTWNWSPKAKASYRTIPVPEETGRLLQRLRLKQGGSPYVFVDLQRVGQIQDQIDETGQLPTKFELRRNLIRDFHVVQRRAAERLQKGSKGQEESEWRLGTIHDMRRTYCTHMASHVPMHVLKEWAGHADISTTAGFYLGLSEGMADRAKEAWKDIG